MRQEVTVYIIGPMRGLPDNNYPAFFAQAEVLRRLGYDVINPAESFSGKQDLPRDFYIRNALEALQQADKVCVLPGWDSAGSFARIEVEIARELGLEITDDKRNRLIFSSSLFQTPPNPPALNSPEPIATRPTEELTAQKSPPTETILEEAMRITSGDRQEAYGHPYLSQSRTAALWDAYVEGKYGSFVEGGEVYHWDFSPEDVSWMTILAKIARGMNRPNRDDLVDTAGYARTIELIREREEENATNADA